MFNTCIFSSDFIGNVDWWYCFSLYCDFCKSEKSPTVDDAYKKSYGLPLKPKKRSSILEYNVSDEYPNDFTVVDLETTGLDVEYDEIVQIAAIKFKGEWKKAGLCHM